MSIQPEISVLILTYEGEKIIQKCIDSVKKQKYEKNIEILVLDNGSSDNTYSMLKDYAGITIYRNKINSSFTYGFNKLYRNSSGKYILILNNDVTLEGEDFFQKLIPILASKDEFGAIAPMSIKPDNSIEQIPKKEITFSSLIIDYTFLGPILNFLNLSNLIIHKNYSLEENIYGADVLQDSCLLVKRSALGNNKIFNEKMRFYYTEDYLGDSIRAQQLQLIYRSDVKVRHLYRHGTSKMGKLRISWIYLLDALGYASQKYNPFLVYFILTPFAFLTLLIRVLYWFIRGELAWKK